MSFLIRLSKMNVIHENTVFYTLTNTNIEINKLIKKPIEIIFKHNIFCISCGKKTTKSFMNGYCFKCFQNAPETSPCVLKPELCEAHLNRGRNIQWEKDNHLQPHVVYLSYTGNIKVGVTRKTNLITRWIDQGALSAIVIAQTPNRYIAGCIEVMLKNIFKDKTSWQAMLKTSSHTVNLVHERHKAHTYINHRFSEFLDVTSKKIDFNYPVDSYPTKIKSLTLDKAPIISGQLKGIKGQYLYLDNEFVFNVRRHSGYEVLLNI